MLTTTATTGLPSIVGTIFRSLTQLTLIILMHRCVVEDQAGLRMTETAEACRLQDHQERPRFRAGASVYFADFADAVQAALELAQSGLHPANCRLLGHEEGLLSGSGDGSRSILVLGFESADHELGPWLAR